MIYRFNILFAVPVAVGSGHSPAAPVRVVAAARVSDRARAGRGRAAGVH